MIDYQPLCLVSVFVGAVVASWSVPWFSNREAAGSTLRS